MRLSRLLIVSFLFLALAGACHAHTFWLESTDEGAHLYLGDAADDEAYEEDSIGEAGAMKLDGSKISASKVYDHGHMHLKAPEANVIWVQADYGYWRKTLRGWQEGTKRDEGRTIASAWHVQYAKLVNKFSESRRVGLELEIVVESVGDGKLRGQVFFKGQPSARTPMYVGHKKVARTDKEGRFKLKLPKKKQVISAVVKEKLTNNPDADQRVVTSTLTFGKLQ